MPRFENRYVHGDLFVEYNVVLPKQLSPQLRKSKHHRHQLQLRFSYLRNRIDGNIRVWLSAR